MPPLDDEHLHLLARWFAGTLPPQDARLIEARLASDPAYAAEVRALQEAWRLAAPPDTPQRRHETALAWEQLLRRRAARRLDDRSPAIPPAPVLTPRRSHVPRSVAHTVARPRWPRIVAAAGVAVAAAAGWLLVRSESSVPPAPMAAADDATREFVAARGQLATVTLRDGSVVRLAPESRIRVAIGDVGTRRVELEGEAVFQVEHDAARPFVVVAGGAHTEDLGTRFLVRAYPGDATAHVAVAEGRVAVRSVRDVGEAPVELSPGQSAIVRSSGEVMRDQADVAALFAWSEGRLRYRRATLAQIATDLSRRFDVRIVVADPQARLERVTVDVPLTTLERALDAITVPLLQRHERRRDTVIIRPLHDGDPR